MGTEPTDLAAFDAERTALWILRVRRDRAGHHISASWIDDIALDVEGDSMKGCALRTEDEVVSCLEAFLRRTAD